MQNHRARPMVCRYFSFSFRCAWGEERTRSRKKVWKPVTGWRGRRRSTPSTARWCGRRARVARAGRRRDGENRCRAHRSRASGGRRGGTHSSVTRGGRARRQARHHEQHAQERGQRLPHVLSLRLEMPAWPAPLLTASVCGRRRVTSPPWRRISSSAWRATTGSSWSRAPRTATAAGGIPTVEVQ
jgi:hypothetical protein